MNLNLTFSKDTFLEWYRIMQLIRQFELKAEEMYKMAGKIRGFFHAYIGQEALAAGAISATLPEDIFLTGYRDHGLALAKGLSPRSCMAELYGKVTGCAKGKGGSMHFFSKEHHFYGGNGIVGAQIGVGGGIAFAEKYKNTNNIVLCFFGDGAVRQGILHETFNLCMLWKLPIIFICENNFYAMGTSIQRTSNVTDIYKMGAAFDMPSESVNGMDAECVHVAIQSAANRARNGDGPSLIEFKTYRYKGHSISDPQKYRSKDEIESYKAKDPIHQLKETLLENKIVTQEELNKIDQKIIESIEDAVQFAENSPFPDDSELLKDIYVDQNYPFIID
ncbi:MAG: pyruvate dehydrogenase (acetyl-transferring) E1 component subunit alpha [Sediminibacterium sp.]|nr:pyruvate dehydrogenase (acetyl-transferring) E1 component subunit alpha [Sediminibacterium sp.]